MDTFIISMTIITGVWLVGISYWMEVPNFISALLFKIVPGIIGTLQLIYAGKLLGWL